MTHVRDRIRRVLHPATMTSIVVMSLVVSFLLRFEYAIPAAELKHLYTGILVAVIAKMTVFRLARCDRGGWRYTGVADVYLVLVSNVAASVLFSITMLVIYKQAFPRSVYCIDFLVCFLGTAGARLAVRLYREGQQ